MTNSKPRCPDCRRVITAENHTPALGTEYCDDCFEQAGLENEHQDGYHDEGRYANCPICTPSCVVDRSKPSNTITDVRKGSHAGCYAINAHEKSRAGRAACRAKKTL
jgi:hypothetical protein